MCNGDSTVKTASLLGISTKSVQNNKLRLFYALILLNEKTRLEGNIVLDETFIADSFKGNRSKSKGFVMDRKSRKRGKDIRKRGVSTEQVSIVTALDERGISVAKVAGLGGSMRYREGGDMYSEREMASRVRHLSMRIKLGLINRSDKKCAKRDASGAPVDIFLTHAPCRGYGDLDDLAHTGFSCFNRFLADFRPKYHCYGHVHMEYSRIRRVSGHPSGTQLINVSGMYLLDI